MGFVNAYLTEEERALFEVAKIPSPVQPKIRGNLNPKRWTIDREKNTALVYCGVPDREEHEKEAFALFLNGISREKLVLVRLERVYKSKDDEYEKLKASLGVDIIVYWKFIDARRDVGSQFAFNTGELVDIKKIASELTAALSVYELDGDPENQFKSRAFVDYGDGV